MRLLKQSNRYVVRLAGLVTFSAIAFYPLPGPSQTLTEKFLTMERNLEQEFEDHFSEDLAEVTQTPPDIAQTLTRIAQETKTKPAVLWVIPRQDHLHLVLLTPGGEPIVRDLYDVPTPKLRQTVQQFHQEVSNPNRKSSKVAAQQLHQWIIEPFEVDYFQAQEIDTILFCLGKGVRGMPLAALHDGEQFLIEKYNLSRIPAFNLIQTDYQPLKQGQLLAMGASEFQEQQPLPAVPTELSTILWALKAGRSGPEQWQGRSYLNEAFTLPRLQQMLASEPFDVVHLATHAEFRPGHPRQSYIQFWDTRLGLDQTDDVDWDLPPLELLVLSACRTALGDDAAELGFAGLALKAGVKSALASLWYVSDFGTFTLMSEFYQHLGVTTTKAAALREAQLKMLNGDIRVEDDQLVLSNGKVDLPPELQNSGLDDLSHPFYWAGFSMVSSPW